MEILNVKERKLNKDLIGYLINGQIFVPIGSESQELKEWLNTNTAEPEYTEEEIKIAEINSQIQESKQYLTETGWYVERLNDPSSGKAIPEEVLAKRAEARELINTLEAELGAM